MKILVLLFLMPTGLIVLGLAGFALMAYRARQARAVEMAQALSRLTWSMAAAAVAFAVMCTPAFGVFLSNILVNNIRGKELTNPRTADAIVVLTGGMVDTGPMGWMPKKESLERLAVAYELQRMINLRIPVIVSGGHTYGVQNPSEAYVAASFFAHMRTELTPTELEETSTDTYESALQLAPVLAKRGAKNVLLVTSDIHMLRSLATYRARGVDVIPAPAMLLPAGRGLPFYLPSPDGLKLTAEALYELYGTFVYLVSGRISWADLAYTPAVQGNLQAQTAANAATGGQDMPLPTLESHAAAQTLQPPVAAPVANPLGGAELPQTPPSVNDSVHIAEPTAPAAPQGGVEIRPAAPVSSPGDIPAVDGDRGEAVN